MLPKDFKRSDELSFSPYFVNLEETNYSRKQLLGEMSVFKRFMERFICDVDELCEILDYYAIPDKDLFEYDLFKTDYIVGKDCIYTEQVIRGRYGWTTKKTYNSIYIKSNTYVGLSLNIVAMEIVKRHFPFLTKAPFVKMEKRFDDSIKNLPKTTMAKLDDIDVMARLNNKLTINDLIKLYTDKTYAESKIEKPLYSVYADSCNVFINLDREKTWSLYLTIDELNNKDWDAIENQHVFSIPLYDKNGNRIKKKWFVGKQKDAPYFNHPLVKALKAELMK